MFGEGSGGVCLGRHSVRRLCLICIRLPRSCLCSIIGIGCARYAPAVFSLSRPSQRVAEVDEVGKLSVPLELLQRRTEPFNGSSNGGRCEYQHLVAPEISELASVRGILFLFHGCVLDGFLGSVVCEKTKKMIPCPQFRLDVAVWVGGERDVWKG